MDITFFDQPEEGPQPREGVRFKQIGLYVYEDLRRVAVGMEMTPFRERPSIEITVINAHGALAGTITLIESLSPNITLVMHLRDQEPTELYELTAQIYYDHPERRRENYHREAVTFRVVEPGEQIFRFDAPGES